MIDHDKRLSEDYLAIEATRTKAPATSRKPAEVMMEALDIQ